MKKVPMDHIPDAPDPKAPIPRQIRYISGNERERVDNMQLLSRIESELEFPE